MGTCGDPCQVGREYSQVGQGKGAHVNAADLFEKHFESELLERVETHPDLSEWGIAGRYKKTPEDVKWWRDRGPGMVQNWVDWKARAGWRVWSTPDGELASELDVVCDIDGQPDPLKMYIDLVMVEPTTKSLVIVDLKTGARTPDSDLQLGVYRLGILKKYGIDIQFGAYWMARKGEMGEVFNLTRFTPRLLQLWFTRYKQATDMGIFIPHPTAMCRACAMRKYCTAYGGSMQHLDPDYAGDDSV